MAELGWLGILVPEAHGGLGLGLAEAAIVAEGLARALVPEPFTATAVLATTVLVGGDNEALKEELLPQIVSGAVLPALAWQERSGTLDVAAIETRSAPFEGGYRLNGTKRFIAGAAGADGFLVSANTNEGVAVFWIERAAPGVALTAGISERLRCPTSQCSVSASSPRPQRHAPRWNARWTGRQWSQAPSFTAS